MSNNKGRGAQQRRLWFFLCAFAIAQTSIYTSTAEAQEQETYASVHLGQNRGSRISAEVNFGGPAVSGGVSLDNDVHAGLSFGRRHGAVRYEIEYQQGQLKIDGAQLGGVSQLVSGAGKYRTVLLNAYRMVELTENFSAFAGAGLGWGELKVSALPAIQNCNCFGAASGDQLTWQLRVGAEYQLAQKNQVLLQYTVLRLPGASSDIVPSVNYGRKNISALTVGYRMSF